MTFFLLKFGLQHNKTILREMESAKRGKKRIAMAVINDLVTDQRVDKVCRSLTEAGYNVTLIGRRLSKSQPISSPYKIERIRLIFNKEVIFYAEYNIRLFLKLLFKSTDMMYANDIDTLPACALAAKLKRKKLFLDAHELFSEVPELLENSTAKRLWQWIERNIIPMTDSATTVCQSVADEYKKRTGVEMTVVRNFAQLNNSHISKKNRIGPKTLLYQGAVNVGRGIDWAIDALEYLDDCILIIAGDGDTLNDMKRKAASKNYSERIKFMGRMTPDELHKLTQQADLGLVLLDNMGLNYYYSLPNRLSDFVQAGIPVIATDFPEISKVIKFTKSGTLIGDEAKKPTILANEIRNALNFWQQMPEDEYQHLFASARKELCWENEKKSLIDTIDTIFSQK